MKEKELERVLKMLANRRRIAIVRFLKERREASVGQIAEAIRLSFKATSKHLGLLASVSIVDREQRILTVWYRLGDEIPDVAKRVIAIL
jgi:DNA-binding transcriptional ArsR family regulator